MTWTYNAAQVTTTLAKVRLLIGDTDTNDQLMSDEEINFLTGQAGNMYGIAALCCDAIAAKLSRRVDKKVGELAISDSQKSRHYATEANRLRRLGNIVSPRAGGISIADKTTQDTDSDRVKPAFARGQFANPGTVDDSRFADYTGEDS